MKQWRNDRKERRSVKKALLLALVAAAIMATAGCANGEGMQEQTGPLPLLRYEHIAKISAGKTGFEQPGDSTIRFLEISLEQDQIERIIEWYNDVASERHEWLADADGQRASIKSGIVFRLDTRGEVRIQYTSSGDVLITVSPPARTYRIQDPEIAALFNELLYSSIPQSKTALPVTASKIPT
jgi:hypothetical protein